MLETRWYDTTAGLTGSQFKAWLTSFTDHLERLGRANVLVDATAFRMDPSQVDAQWRDATIIPRYEAAGVRKIAFHMPPGMPLVGKAPEPEGPATFPTGYFDARADALDWLLT